MFEKVGGVWGEEMRKFSTTLFMYSPKAYKYVRTVMPLPSPRTIQRWLSSINGNPGFFVEAANFLSAKVRENPLRYGQCSLVIGGISIREQTEWDASTKQEIGKMDFGFGPEGETDATEAVVFLCVGLYGGWTLPVGYVLTSRCKHR